MDERREEQERAGREELENWLRGSPWELEEGVGRVHPADLAEWMLDLDDEEAWRVLDALPPSGRAAVFAEMEDSLRGELVRRLTPRQLGAIVAEMPDDEAVDLLALADPQAREQVLSVVEHERAHELRVLAAFPEESAGGVMAVEVVSVPEEARVGDAIKRIKSEGEEVREGRGVWVVDGEGRPVGYLADRALLTHSIHTPVREVMSEPFTIEAQRDREEAAQLIQHYGLDELAVVDAAGMLIGTITAEDALEVAEEEASEDFHKLVGTGPQLQTRLSIRRRVFARLPLQGLTVLGGLATAWVLERTLAGEQGLSAESDLLRFVPIVIGLAGNVGIQASTILVRAFATGEVEPERERSVLVSEVLVGLAIGLLCGGATAVVTGWSEGGAGGWLFGGSVGLAICAAVTWAAFLGCAVPMVCRRAGIDPAIAAGPFLISVSDLSGTTLYVLIARLLVVS